MSHFVKDLESIATVYNACIVFPGANSHAGNSFQFHSVSIISYFQIIPDKEEQ